MNSPEFPVTVAKSSELVGRSPNSPAPSYAFLVHSQKTLTQNLPPRVDNKLLARQKRRRTRWALPSTQGLMLRFFHICIASLGWNVADIDHD